MERLSVRSGDLNQLTHGLDLQREGGLNRRDRTAVRNQGQHLRDDLCPYATKERCSLPGAEGLAADQAARALAFLAMNANVSLSDLPTCRTRQIRAKRRLRIDGHLPSASSTEECHLIRSFFKSDTAITI